MSGYKDILKKGWHPEKEGSSFRGQMKSLVGRGDDNNDRSSHVAAPLSSLRDPSSFGPPPKRTDSGLSYTPSAPAARPAPAAPARAGPPPPPRAGSSSTITPPLTEEEPPAPKPWRMDTTGLSTSHLPPPPSRKDGADGRTASPVAPPPYSVTASSRSGPPSLPPRLPPRSGTGSPAGQQAATHPSPPPPDRSSTPNASLLNQGAVNRLGSAGISVPGFGIGSASPQPSANATASSGQDLASRFSKLGTSSASPAAVPQQGTTFAQKQAAFKTASAFRQDPSSVSLADARSAASTSNNFRQRHGEQAASGLQSAKNANDRFGVVDKATYTNTGAPAAAQMPSSGASAFAAAASLAKKKPGPPPPPKKKPNLAAHSTGQEQDEGPPPPVPMSTRPQF